MEAVRDFLKIRDRSETELNDSGPWILYRFLYRFRIKNKLNFSTTMNEPYVPKYNY